MSSTPLSFSGKLWALRACVDEVHRQLAEEFGLGGLFASVFACRGVATREAVTAFLHPRLKNLSDPLELRDMRVAVERLVHAIQHAEPIAVFGDYDVDGATSAALIFRYLRWLGVTARVYIPDRFKEGYGPNPGAMRQLAAEGIRLVVTVDCGIGAHEAVAAATAAGMEVIVTDHHQQGGEGLPPALAVINPNRLDEEFGGKELAGVGVAFYLVMALNRELRRLGWFSAVRPEPDLKQLLDLVAVGTVADVANLVGVNRALVVAGLKQIESRTNPGLAALLRLVGIDGELHTWQIGFQLGPRINAGGRLGRSHLGVELLTTEDPVVANQLAATLDDSNRERQGIEREIVEAAQRVIVEQGLLDRRMGLVVAGEGWHQGVIGIVASRLAEQHHRPVIVITFDGNGDGKGSGRSVTGVDILAAIDAAREHLTVFGGHKAAAGLSLRRESLDPFAEGFDRAIREQNSPYLFHPRLYVDHSMEIPAIDREVWQALDRIQPFGMGNPEPVLRLEQVRVSEAKVIKERHVKCRLVAADGSALEGICFGALPGGLGEQLLAARERIDVAGMVQLNRYQQRERVQFQIKDARPAGYRLDGPAG